MSSQDSEPIRGVSGADLIVVGGGVIGLACAWRAAKEGAEVVVVDAGPAERASTVAAGMIAPVGEASWGEERLLRLGLDSARDWPDFAAELEADAGREVPYRVCGAVHVALDRDELAELRRIHELHDRLELGSEWMTGSAMRALEPGLATDTAGGFHAPSEAEVDPRALLDGLTAACASRGVRIAEEPVERVLIANGVAVAGVALASGEELRGQRVLVANGAWAAELLPDGSPVPVRPVKGEVVRLRAPAGEAPCERIVVTERIYVVPRGERPGEPTEVVLGATVEDRGFDTRVTAGGVHELLREAYRAVPEIAELELVEATAGLRPGSPDNAPAIGWGSEEGLLVAVGHYRNGILLAPVTGRAIADLLAGREPPPSVHALGPGRFRPQDAAGSGLGGRDLELGSENASLENANSPMSGQAEVGR